MLHKVLDQQAVLRYCQTRMFFSCKDEDGDEHELVFVQRCGLARDHPAVFSSSVYLKWLQHIFGRPRLNFPMSGVVNLQLVHT